MATDGDRAQSTQLVLISCRSKSYQLHKGLWQTSKRLHTAGERSKSDPWYGSPGLRISAEDACERESSGLAHRLLQPSTDLIVVQYSRLTDCRRRSVVCQFRGFGLAFFQGANLFLPYLNKLMPILGNEVSDILVASVCVVHVIDDSW